MFGRKNVSDCMCSAYRYIALLLILCLLCAVTGTVYGEEEVSDRVIQLNLDSATDEELAEAIARLTQEQKDRIITKVTLDQTELTVAKGKSAKLVSEVTDQKENVKISKTLWTSSDVKIAKVQNGTVIGVGGGKAVITCTVIFSDGLELSADCHVTVIVAATSVLAKPNSYTLGIGESQKLDVTIKPDDVSSKKLKYTSENSQIVSVNENGTMTAVHGGKTTVTVSTTDGSEKSAKVTVYVPSVSANKTNYIITQKAGGKITLNYYGTRSNLNVTSTGNVASVSHSLTGNELSITVKPNKAGTFAITVSDKSDAKSKVTLKVTIDHSAVYDSVSYPKIEYDGAARYPSSYKGGCCSFSGRVLQVMDGWGETVCRISSRGRWDNVVYVTIKNSNITTPIIEDDNVTVYGTYDGNYTYKSILGASITLPSVSAEKIIVK